MKKTNTLSDKKDILREMTYGNLKKICKMQVKSCKNIFRIYQKQDNFSIELKSKEKVMLQTSFGLISADSSTILMVLIILKSP